MDGIEIDGLHISIMGCVYPPSEDTFLMIDALKSVEVSGSGLELCSGTGAIGLAVAGRLDSIVAIDINPLAVENTRRNYLENSLYVKLYAVAGDLFNPLKKVGFDLILMNPPYLADDKSSPEDPSWSGGEAGREVVDRFLGTVGDFLSREGRAIFLQSDLNGIEESLGRAESMGMVGKVLRSINFQFESLVAIELKHANSLQKD
jgi:release factor glutamine methyltransferase